MTGAELAKARARLGDLSQEALADLLNTSQSSVSRWEKRRDEAIPHKYNKRVARLLRQAKLGALSGAPGAPAPDAVLLQYPDGYDGPRVWIERPNSFLARIRKKVSPPGGGTAPSGTGGGTGGDAGVSGAPGGPPGGEAAGAETSSQAKPSPLFPFTLGTVLAGVLLGGCLFLRGHSGGGPDLRSQDPYTTNSLEMGNSFPMPKEPYSWQKRAPCDKDRGELEKIDGCWMLLATPPPCSRAAVKDGNTCLVPIPAPPPRPPSSLQK